MSHTSTAAEVGHVLVVVGAVMVVIWTLVDVANGWRQVRALGRRVLRVVGPLTRSSRRREHERVRPSPIRLRVDVDPRAVDKLIAEFDARRERGGP